MTSLRDSLEASGIVRDDPLHPFMCALSDTLEQDRADRAKIMSQLEDLTGRLQRQHRIAGVTAPKQSRETIWRWLGFAAVIVVCLSLYLLVVLYWTSDSQVRSVEKWNDLHAMLANCQPPHVTASADGRRACVVTLWIEPPAAAK
jgi:hypothetical protein